MLSRRCERLPLDKSRSNASRLFISPLDALSLRSISNDLLMASVPDGTHAEAGQQTATTSPARCLNTVFQKAWKAATEHRRRPHSILIGRFDVETGPMLSMPDDNDKLRMTLSFEEAPLGSQVHIDGDKHADWESRNQDELCGEDFGELLRRVLRRIYSEYRDVTKQVPELARHDSDSESTIDDSSESTDDDSPVYDHAGFTYIDHDSLEYIDHNSFGDYDVYDNDHPGNIDYDRLGTIYVPRISHTTTCKYFATGPKTRENGTCYAEWARFEIPEYSPVVETQFLLEIWSRPANSSQHIEGSEPLSPQQSEPPNTSDP